MGLSVSYGALHRLIADGYMFDLFKGVGRRLDWKEYEGFCIDRIKDRV